MSSQNSLGTVSQLVELAQIPLSLDEELVRELAEFPQLQPEVGVVPIDDNSSRSF